ncbi:FG-GAP repeat domain-containing protein [Streptomyces sp. IBSBF 3136]|uniref:FG-GAP repeat domain-containing protein n=1 Tax=Streptomyces sp. IBSBF 3136 TaxID=2903524 RepID=UPI002FDC17E8
MPVRTTATLATFLVAGLVPLSLPVAAATAAPAKYDDDFNGDGYRDYAYSSFSARGGGGVTVVFGTATGPGPTKQRITQSSPGVPGTDEADDMFGEVRAAAHFDGDGYGDLAVAATGENSAQGAVTILWGSPSGLSTGTTLPNKNPGRNNYMGKDLATGDFNGDGKQDLAVINESRTYVYRGPFKRSGTTGTVTKTRAWIAAAGMPRSARCPVSRSIACGAWRSWSRVEAMTVGPLRWRDARPAGRLRRPAASFSVGGAGPRAAARGAADGAARHLPVAQSTREGVHGGRPADATVVEGEASDTSPLLHSPAQWADGGGGNRYTYRVRRGPVPRAVAGRGRRRVAPRGLGRLVRAAGWQEC